MVLGHRQDRARVVAEAAGPRSRRHADEDAVDRGVLRHDGVRADDGARADRDGAEDLGARADRDAVADGGMPLAAVARPSAERHTVVEHDVVAHFGRLADDDAHAVIDEEAAADRRAGVDLDAREPAHELRARARDESEAAPPEPVVDTVGPDGVQTGVEERDLESAARGGVAELRRDEVFAHACDGAHEDGRRAGHAGRLRLAQMLVERRREVALAGIGDDHDDAGAGRFWPGRDLQGRPDGGARRHPREDSLVRRELARDADRVVELDVEDLVDDAAVQDVRHEVRADALDAVAAGPSLGQHGGVLGLDECDPHVGVSLFEHLADACDRAAGPRSRDEPVDAALGVAPDLLGGRAAVDLGIGGMLELTREDRPGRLGDDALRRLDRLGHALVRVGEDELGAVRLEQSAALLRHRGGHREDDLVAARRADEGERDARVAARRLDDRAARLELAGRFGRGDEGDSEAVLDARAGVVELELHEDLGAEPRRQAVEPHERSVAEGGRDVGMDAGQGLLPGSSGQKGRRRAVPRASRDAGAPSRRVNSRADPRRGPWRGSARRRRG